MLELPLDPHEWWLLQPFSGASNDPKPLRLNMFSLGNMGVMICLGQRGLRSLSASSCMSASSKASDSHSDSDIMQAGRQQGVD